MKLVHFSKIKHTIIFIPLYVVLLFLKTTYGNKININVKLSHKRHYKARYHDYHTKKHHKQQQHHHHNKEKTHHKESKKTENNSKKSSNNIGENNNGVITKTFTFKDLNLLSDDLVLKGVNPRYDFYIPTLPQMVSGKVYLNIQTYPYLRKDSTITILLNNVPYETFKADNIPPEIDIPIKKSNNHFVKISILGDLHISENVCVDAFSEKLYLIVSKNSKVEFNYKKPDNNIREFLIDYNNDYCIYSPTLIPFIYQMCKENPIPCKVYYNQNIKNCKKIEPSNDNNLILNKDTLYVPITTTTKAFENGIFPSYLFGEAERINKAIVESKTAKTEVSLKELGIKTTTIEGVSNLNYTIPIDTAKLGGIPKNLYFRLLIANTPINKNGDEGLRIYLNNNMIAAYSIRNNKNSFDIKIPTDELSYGKNYLNINLVDFENSNTCSGNIPRLAFTIFGSSYFYWDKLKNKPKNISDFLKDMHGNVAFIIKDENFYPLATKLSIDLADYDKSISSISINPKNLSKYDFVIMFESPKDTANMPIELNKGDFEIFNPLTKKVIFSSTPSEAFAVMMVKIIDNKPTLVFSYYKDPSGINDVFKYHFSEFFGLVGNTAIATKDFISSYEVGQKLRIKYKYSKGLSYYWNKYKLWIIILLTLPVTIFLAYTYVKLTRRKT
ncbi:MAG TPA: hypothetical protein ENO33_04795 [Hydrogenobaculum sp.]|nr:hypothetical protein [Hydrogenobaculum sp.]